MWSYSRVLLDNPRPLLVDGFVLTDCKFAIWRSARAPTRPTRSLVAAQIKNVYLSRIMLITRKRVYCSPRTPLQTAGAPHAQWPTPPWRRFPCSCAKTKDLEILVCTLPSSTKHWLLLFPSLAQDQDLQERRRINRMKFHDCRGCRKGFVWITKLPQTIYRGWRIKRKRLDYKIRIKYC